MQSTLLLVRVHNMGETIPTAQLAAIFRPFQRGRNASKKPGNGNGIGLALVDRIIRLHQGILQVESSDEAGTTFTVNQPR